MITATNKPIAINRLWFRARYGQNFPDLLAETNNDLLDSCINDVYTMFAGVGELWSHMPRLDYVNKTQMCYGLLVAWYITDMYPEYASGVVSSGGIPIDSKRIGNVSIKYNNDGTTSGAVNNADLLKSLKSNAFGAKAYMMIKTSGKLNMFFAR